jgi:uncharacterized membrane protein YkoI
MIKSIYTVTAIAITLGFLSTNALADIEDPRAIEAVANEFGLISLEEAKAKALVVRPGRIKEVELARRKYDQGWDYEGEIIDANGREWEVDIDAKTGEVLKNKLD